MQRKRVTLTITKKYFNLILCGQKQIEYRKDAPYYHKALRKDVTEILFHYYVGIYMLCDVELIEFIPRPDHLENSPFITTQKCFAIHVRNPRWIDHQGTKS